MKLLPIDQIQPLKFGKTTNTLLVDFLDTDVTASEVASHLRKNQVYRDLFSRFIDAKSSDSKEVLTAHRMVGLLGMEGSRNLLVALRMHRAVNKQFPFTKEGALQIRPGEYLKKSKELEELFQKHKLPLPEMAYVVGLCFDWFEYWLESNKERKKIEEFIQENWRLAKRSLVISALLCREWNISGRAGMPPGPLSHLGKIVLARTVGEAYFKQPTKTTPIEYRIIYERKTWGLTYEEAAANMLFHMAPIIRPTLPSLRHSCEPYILLGTDQYATARLAFLSNLFAAYWKIPEEKDQLPFLKHPCLKSLKVPPNFWMKLMKQALACS